MIQTTFQRYEKKYLLTPAQYQWIFQQLQSRMQVDEYGMYPICSIYFDTDDYRLHPRLAGKAGLQGKAAVAQLWRSLSHGRALYSWN